VFRNFELFFFQLVFDETEDCESYLVQTEDRGIVDREDVEHGSFVDEARRIMRMKRQSEVQWNDTETANLEVFPTPCTQWGRLLASASARNRGTSRCTCLVNLG
jgi:hypothetical protein